MSLRSARARGRCIRVRDNFLLRYTEAAVIQGRLLLLTPIGLDAHLQYPKNNPHD